MNDAATKRLSCNFFVSSAVLFMLFIASFPVIKIGDVKIGEILAIFLLFLSVFKINKIFLVWIIFCVWILFSSISVSIFTDFFIPATVADNLLKSPFVFSTTRFVSMLSCIGFANSCYFLKLHMERKGSGFWEIFFKWFVLLQLFFVIAWISSFFASNVFVYANSRLRAGFVEGGPYGLYVAFFTTIFYIVGIRGKWSYILLFVAILLSQSKFAYLYVGAFFFLKIISIGKKTFLSSVLFLSMFTVVFFINFQGNLAWYADRFFEAERFVAMFPNDKGFVMGRISGTFIGYRMIVDNPVLGVGIGNYSLTRNNPAYLGFFPSTIYWDIASFGLLDIVVENGFLSLFLYLGICVYYFFKLRKNRSDSLWAIVAFVLISATSVAIHFSYIWMAWVVVADGMRRGHDKHNSVEILAGGANCSKIS